MLDESEGETPLALIEHIFAFICWEETVMKSCEGKHTHRHWLPLPAFSLEKNKYEIAVLFITRGN